MIIEERVYSLRPGALEPYLEHYRQAGLAASIEVRPFLVGYFQTLPPGPDTIVHLWHWPSYEERSKCRGALAGRADWRSHLSHIRPLVARQEVRLLQPRHIADLGQPLSALTVTRIEDALAPGHLDQYWRLTEERSRQTSLLLADVDIGTLNRPLTYAVDPGSVASTDNLGRALGEAFLHRSVCTLAPVPVAEMAPLFR